MPLFRRTRATASVGPVPFLDPAEGSAAAAAALEHARGGDLDAFDEALNDLPIDDVSVVLRAAADLVPLPVATDWAVVNDEYSFAHVLRGAILSARAADARGSAPAKDTSEGQFASFAELTAAAEAEFRRALDLDPEDVEAWTQLMVTVYSSGDVALLERALKRVRQIYPWHVHALTTAVDLLGEKWYGGPGHAESLAREVAASAPDGSPALTVVPHMVRERWLYLHVFANDAAGRDRWLDDPEVRAWVYGALERCLDPQEHVPSAVSVRVLNDFAFVLHLFGDHARAAPLFQQLDGRARQNPWALLNEDPLRAFAAAQTRALS